MIFLISCLLTNVGIFIAFRILPIIKANTLATIVVNYIVCVLTGIAFIGHVKWVERLSLTDPMIQLTIVMGIIFVVTFTLMALTTRKSGMTVASIASKTSLIIPILANLLLFKTGYKNFDIVNIVGICFALPAIVLSSYKKKENKQGIKSATLLLPLGVFILGGTIDTSINYANIHLVPEALSAVFPLLVFFFAAVSGLLYAIAKRIRFDKRSILLGTGLGIINYFSMYFLVRALGSFNNDGAIVFSVMNVGIIIVSALISKFIFKDQLSRMNWIGVGLAVLAVLGIFYQEIFNL